MHHSHQKLTEADERSSIQASWMPMSSPAVNQTEILQRRQHIIMWSGQGSLAEQQEHLNKTAKQQIGSQMAGTLF